MTEECPQLNAGESITRTQKQDCEKTLPLLTLPNQLINLILSFLSTGDLLAFQLTNKEATEIVINFHKTKQSSSIPIKPPKKEVSVDLVSSIIILYLAFISIH